MTAQFVDVPMFDAGVTFSGEVHPYAAAFPMLPDADLDALAADIKANGLLNPILLDRDGRLLDGRNRLAACDRAGVAPTFQTVEAPDPVALIITANMQRRDLTQAQKAHLLVESRSDSDHLSTRELAAVAGVPHSKIVEAAIVARFTPEASRAVIEGRLTHAAAYDAARAAKKVDEDTRTQRATLQEKAPDLLDLAHAEAWAAYQERTKKDREAAEAAERNRVEASTGLATAVAFLAARTRGNYTDQTLAQYQPEDLPQSARITAEAIDQAIDTLTHIRKARFA